jgi:DNA adenine methylase
MSAPTRPVLRYHGGKFRLAHWVIAHFPAHQVYVEPFGGAASVLMRKPRSPGEIYNDVDDEIVGLFRVLRDPSTAERLRQRMILTPFARSEFRASYEPTEDPVERAARLVTRSFMGFGSDSATRGSITGFRIAVSREVFTDFVGGKRKDGGGQSSAIDWAAWPAAIPAFVRRLSGVVIENRCGMKVMEQSDFTDALHYVDPPYPKSTRTRVGKGRGYRHEMSDDEHRLLASCLHGLRGMVVLSGYRCALYDDLFAEWHRVDRHHRAQQAKASVESLWLNPAAYNGLSQRPLL